MAVALPAGLNPGLCECGCGEQTKLAPQTRVARGWVKGEPMRFVSGHATRAIPRAEREAMKATLRQQFADAAVEYGTCCCGCGQRTPLSKQDLREKGWVAGEPRMYVHGHGSRSSSVEYVVSEDGCWIWCLARNKKGYGLVTRQGKSQMAYRWYYEQMRGPIPEGLHLDHLCRNPSCVNPDHLEPVTNAENQRRGLNTKLTAEDVRFIRRTDLNGADVARLCGVTQSQISAVRHRRAWRDID